MLEQKRALWKHLKERVEEQKRLQSLKEAVQSEMGEGKEESIVEITMEMEDVDAKMDTTIVEQGTLPKARGWAEQQVYKRLVTFEMNPIQWRFEALSYLASIVEMNKQAHERGDEK